VKEQNVIADLESARKENSTLEKQLKESKRDIQALMSESMACLFVLFVCLLFLLVLLVCLYVCLFVGLFTQFLIC
jgi:hypothetical protein